MIAAPPTLYSPPRYWWLKRLMLLVVVLLVGFPAFHWWLWARVDARLSRIVDGWRQQPGAPLPEHFQLVTGAAGDERNAASHYLRALEALPELTAQQKQQWQATPRLRVPEEGVPREMVPPGEVALLRQILQQAQPSLEHARESRRQDHSNRGRPRPGPTAMADPVQVRDLAYRIDWGMMLDHHDADLAAAAEKALDLHHLAAAHLWNSPSLRAGWVSHSVIVAVTSRLRTIAWHPPPGMSPEQERLAWKQAEPQIRRVIATLLDEAFDRELALRTWQGKRLELHNEATALVSAAGATARGVVTTPILEADLARLLENDDRVVAMIHSGDRQGLLGPLPGVYKRPATAAGLVARLLSSVLDRPAGGTMVQFHDAAAERRLTAVILAARLFHADQGRWPESLEELAPSYLPHVPRDPWAPERPLSFRAGGPVPIVYSIGRDQVDDGGSTAPSATSPTLVQSRRDGWPSADQRRDLVFPLYLPEAYFKYPCSFNIWNYLLDPADVLERAPAAIAARRAEANLPAKPELAQHQGADKE